MPCSSWFRSLDLVEIRREDADQMTFASLETYLSKFLRIYSLQTTHQSTFLPSCLLYSCTANDVFIALRETPDPLNHPITSCTQRISPILIANPSMCKIHNCHHLIVFNSSANRIPVSSSGLCNSYPPNPHLTTWNGAHSTDALPEI